MATDSEIRKSVRKQHRFIPDMGWIAHVKEVHGIPTVRGAERVRPDGDIEPCPPCVAVGARDGGVRGEEEGARGAHKGRGGRGGARLRQLERHDQERGRKP